VIGVTIIVCTKNRCAMLLHSLDALKRVHVPAGIRAELVIVDNGSTDLTRAVLSNYDCSPFLLTIKCEVNGGKSTALNRALAATRGDFVLLLDDDVRPAVGWLEHLTSPLISGQFDVVAGAVHIPSHLRPSWMTPTQLAWVASTEYLDSSSPQTAVGANMGFSRRILEQVPGFDACLGPGRLGLWEDTLFSLQTEAAGFRLGMVNEAIVEHHFDPNRLTRDAFLARARAEAHSSAYVTWHWKHETRTWCSLRLLLYQCRLVIERARPSRWLNRHRIWQRELDLVCGIEYERSYLRESVRPRAYDYRGLRKRINMPQEGDGRSIITRT
jgi:glycosyltransferase involved in cell wall biosynthesis